MQMHAQPIGRFDVSVQASQTTSVVKLKLLRTGAVSGRILDADGDPISGVNVVVSLTGATKNARPGSWYATTNDRGEYRVFNIAPAGYRVSATSQPVAIRLHRNK
jgi:protocatechuate 3,4-dioxygenase beta subunit